MPTTLTDVDTWSSPALVPVDGDAATAASVIAEFQALQNRSLYNKNRTTTAKSEIDGLYLQVVDNYIPLAPVQVSQAGGLLSSRIPASFASVTDGNFVVAVTAGDLLSLHIGPIDFAALGSTGSFRVRITEDIGVSDTPQVDADRVYFDTGHRSLTIPKVYLVTKTGNLAVDLQIKGDGAVGAVAGTDSCANWATYQIFRKIT